MRLTVAVCRHGDDEGSVLEEDEDGGALVGVVVSDDGVVEVGVVTGTVVEVVVDVVLVVVEVVVVVASTMRCPNILI